jgi:hypothetical protein
VDTSLSRHRTVREVAAPLTTRPEKSDESAR